LDCSPRFELVPEKAEWYDVCDVFEHLNFEVDESADRTMLDLAEKYVLTDVEKPGDGSDKVELEGSHRSYKLAVAVPLFRVATNFRRCCGEALEAYRSAVCAMW
jgi:hypothetical protein